MKSEYWVKGFRLLIRRLVAVGSTMMMLNTSFEWLVVVIDSKGPVKIRIRLLSNYEELNKLTISWLKGQHFKWVYVLSTPLYRFGTH